MVKLRLEIRYSIQRIFFLFLLLNLIFGIKIFAQGNGALFMLKDNFHSNLLNPSYVRNDKVVVISIPGLAGATFGNSGNFKLSDLIYKDETGQLVFDVENVNNTSGLYTSLINWSSVPWLYVSIPARRGRLTFYLKEQVQSSLYYDLNSLQLLSNGNVPQSFKSYNTNNINYSGIGYRELAAGYSKNVREDIVIGIRGKILFGGVYAGIKDWNYGIYTADNAESVVLTSSGSGKLSLPVPLVINKENRIVEVKYENALKKYIGTFQNPGLGLDLGATVTLNEKSWLSASINDIGAIWFRKNAFKVEQNASYTFTGFEISNSIERNKGELYVDPYTLMSNAQDSVFEVYWPKGDSVGFVESLVPKMALHYQYNINEVLSIGTTNQTAFYKNAILNLFTLSAMQKKGGLSVFESLSVYGFNSVTFGAGIQWESRFVQVFAVADNLAAVYHPARSESYSITVGLSLLFNKPKKRKSDGEFSPHFPFYKNMN